MIDMSRSYSAQGRAHNNGSYPQHHLKSTFPSRPVLSRQQSAPGPMSPPSIAPPGAGDNNIRCSDCGAWVDLMNMGEHRCGRGAVAEAPRPAQAPNNDRWRRPDMRLDIPTMGKRVQAFGDRLSPRGPPEGFDASSPLTPLSYPASPNNVDGGQGELSRSYSSASSVSSSSSKLPFFERYQKLVGTGNAPHSQGSLPRSNPAENLHSISATSLQTPPLTPSAAYANTISSTPSPSAPNFPGLSRSVNSPNDNESDLPYASSGGSRSSNPYSQPSETPASSVRSNSPPRSRKISMPESQSSGVGRSGHVTSSSGDRYSPQGARGDVRGGQLSGSQSTPTKLGAFGSIDRPLPSQPNQRRAPPERSNTGGSGLDACLEDLRLMADDDDDIFSGDGQGGLPTPRPQPRRNISASRSTPTLSSPGADSRDASLRCVTCRRPFKGSDEVQRAGDGQPFCRPCYADRFLPKCRKCTKPIEGGAVTSSDGKVLGKYHPACFSCFTCSEQFTSKEFYVFDHKPYCQLHYHELNGSLCADRRCGQPIEGPCVSLVGEEKGGGGRYHPECFKCATCQTPLPDHHYVVGGLPYCERHVERESPRARPAQQGASSKAAAMARARKRQTIITR